MKLRLSVLIVFLVFLCFFSFIHTYPCLAQHFHKDVSSLLVKNGEESSPGEDSGVSSPPGIDEFEKEKLAKFKSNIGKRFLTVKKINPAVFYESPDDLERKLTIKREKEGFVITEVVQNQSGTMNFYQVRFDTGQIGYLSADGNYLDLKIKEGSLIYVPKRKSSKKGVSQSKGLGAQAVELVKSHPTPAGSVEKRMRDEKAKSFPFPRWRYEAKEIEGKKFRVLQYVEERSAPVFVRAWIVDLSTNEIKPENRAAKEMYR
ncbi:MAG: hypothetical protein ACXU9W_14245 [Thermodesulfobacteriota bacterium]